MTRLTQLTDEAAAPAAKELFAAIKSKVGMVPNLYRVLANEPAALAANLGSMKRLAKAVSTPKPARRLPSSPLAPIIVIIVLPPIRQFQKASRLTKLKSPRAFTARPATRNSMQF